MKADVDVFEDLRIAAYAYGVPRLAALMGVPVGTLYNKLNLNESTHHRPTLADFIQIVSHTTATAPMQSLCRLLGGAFYELPDMSHMGDDALLDIINRLHAEAGDVFRALGSALDDGHITVCEERAIDREVDHWLSAILELRARVRAMAQN